MRGVLFAAIAASITLARAHQAPLHPSMWGYHVRTEDFTYDNRPVTPLQQYPFNQWWLHGHLDYPPAAGNFLEFPAGGKARTQIACDLAATDFWPDSAGNNDLRKDDYPCPGYPISQFHGLDDLKGCGFAIAYTSDVGSIKPEDLTIFTVNHTCVWYSNTYFDVPKDMPPCPEGGCICTWHWIHSKNSGSAQMFMNGYRCKITGSTSTKTLMKPEVPKRCTGDLSKCNQGAQQPLYWFQAEGNNMFNDQYDPPYYLDEWGFTDGPQDKIFASGSSGGNTLIDKTSMSMSMSMSDDKPSSTPVESNPSSTPVDDKPTPTPTLTPEISPIESPPTGGSSVNLPKPSSSSQGDGEGNTKTSTTDPHPPTPSKTQQCEGNRGHQCDGKKGRTLSEPVPRRFKYKRHHARGDNH